jgi:hypothetical protein
MAPPLVGGGLAALELLWSRADLLLAALIGSGSLSRAEPSFSNTKSSLVCTVLFAPKLPTTHQFRKFSLHSRTTFSLSFLHYRPQGVGKTPPNLTI